MARRSAGVLVALALVALVAAPTAASDSHGISCRLTGVVHFKPALTVEPHKTKVDFSGHMTHCVSTDNAITSSEMHATAVSNGGCSYGMTEGTIDVKWDDGTKTLMPFTAESVGAGAFLHGEAGESNSSVVKKGDPIGGFLWIDADPALCASGLKTATLQGQGFGGNGP